MKQNIQELWDSLASFKTYAIQISEEKERNKIPTHRNIIFKLQTTKEIENIVKNARGENKLYVQRNRNKNYIRLVSRKPHKQEESGVKYFKY